MGFWTGAIVGGVAGAAFALWTAPQSGTELRDSLLNEAENRVSSFGGMDVWTPEDDLGEASDLETDSIQTQS